MKPAVLAQVVSNLLYERRMGPYFCEPIVAGLHDGKPQLFGREQFHRSVQSPCSLRSHRLCLDAEGLRRHWRRRDADVRRGRGVLATGYGARFIRTHKLCFLQTEDETFEATSQSLLAGLERAADCGWGCIVYTVGVKGTTVKTLKARMD